MSSSHLDIAPDESIDAPIDAPIGQTTDAPTDAAERRLWGMDEAAWRRIRIASIALYVAAYVWWFAAQGIIVDRISVLLSVVLFLIVGTIGRPWRDWLRLGRDAGLFVLMWVAYDESRGVADRIGMPVQVESVRDIDRFIFLGTDPTVWLQHRFHEGPDSVRWYDVAGSIVYFSHFIVPPVVIATLYIANRHQWGRYMRRFATVLFVACTMFILLPTAPPWMAAGGRNNLGLELDALEPLTRPTGEGWRHIGLGAFVRAWDTGRDWANQVAAMPSLHAAFALFVVVFLFRWVTSWWMRAVMLLYPLAMATTLMYFGEHYFADALAGWAVVGASFLLWHRIERGWVPRADAERDGTASSGRPGSVEELAPTTAPPSEQSGVRTTVDV